MTIRKIYLVLNRALHDPAKNMKARAFLGNQSVELIDELRQYILDTVRRDGGPSEYVVHSQIRMFTNVRWCGHCDEWRDDDFSEVDSEMVCQNCFEEAYYWDCDGDYHWEPEPEPEPEYDDDDGADDDESGGRGQLSCYHAAGNRSWRRNAERMCGFGIELECLCSSTPRTSVAYALRGHDLICETDGSLDESRGMEIIGLPYSLEAYHGDKTPWKSALETLIDEGVIGHSAGTGYSIHVSISRSMFTDLAAAKFICFINRASDLSQFVAQRSVIYHGGYTEGAKTGGCSGRRLNYQSMGHTFRYAPVAWYEKRLEVRIFRANLRYDRMLKAIEYCDAVRSFVGQTSISEIDARNKNALTFAFLDNVAKRRKQWPNLVSFFRQHHDNYVIVSCGAGKLFSPDNNRGSEY